MLFAVHAIYVYINLLYNANHPKLLPFSTKHPHARRALSASSTMLRVRRRITPPPRPIPLRYHVEEEVYR